MNKTRPEELREGFIGVFDSGVGGLSVLREIRVLLPMHDLGYIADSAWVPYGDKPPEKIVERSRLLARWLADRGAAAIVVACNTATAAAAQALREELTIPVIGMEPAVKPAVAATRSRIIGVLATSGTLKSARFAGLLDRFGRGYEVLITPAPRLVEAVEAGIFQGDAIRQLVAEHLDPLIEAGADVIVLGCTHFPFLRETIAAVAGECVKIIDTGSAVARQAARQLPKAPQKPGEVLRSGAEKFFTTSADDRAPAIIRKLWNDPSASVALLDL